jgi:hypothetical protein
VAFEHRVTHNYPSIQPIQLPEENRENTSKFCVSNIPQTLEIFQHNTTFLPTFVENCYKRVYTQMSYSVVMRTQNCV